MNNRIFFKDKAGDLKGPFNERQIQEWYRAKWFDNDFPFYFSSEAEETVDISQLKSFSLEKLCSSNGFGAPFFEFDDEKKSDFHREVEEREQKMARLKQEIRATMTNCNGIDQLNERVETLEKQVEALTAAIEQGLGQENEAEEHQAQEQSATEEKRKRDGRDCFLNALMDGIGQVITGISLYATTKYEEWDKEQAMRIRENSNFERCWSKEYVENLKNTVCSPTLVKNIERLLAVCCDICQAALFNQKQILIHFTSLDHIRKETRAVKDSGLPEMRQILDQLSNLPAILAAEDEMNERLRIQKFAGAGGALRPARGFVEEFEKQYAYLISSDSNTSQERYDPTKMFVATRIATEKAMGPIGVHAMGVLHDHIGTANTHCSICRVNTGPREEYYAHLISSFHIKKVTDGSKRFDLVTFLTNVHKKEFM